MNQLNPTRTRAKGDNLDCLLKQDESLAVDKSKSVVARQRLFQVGHDDRDVMQLGISKMRGDLIQSSH